jgi:hypothetical protein
VRLALSSVPPESAAAATAIGIVPAPAEDHAPYSENPVYASTAALSARSGDVRVGNAPDADDSCARMPDTSAVTNAMR